MSTHGDLAIQKLTGLDRIVRRMEAEHADEAAQASVEGRPFVPPLGGIGRSPSRYWRNRVSSEDSAHLHEFSRIWLLG